MPESGPALFTATPAAPMTVPFRDRRALPDGLLAFGPDADGFRLLVAPAVAAALRCAAQEALPAETFGMLTGRAFEDDAGPYTVVTSAVEADAGDTTPSGVRIPAGAMGDVRRRAVEARPAEDLMGWWHSHPGQSAYSRTDRAEQASWPRMHHVGLLVFPHGRPWARAYRGPDAVALEEHTADPVLSVPPHDRAPLAGTVPRHVPTTARGVRPRRTVRAARTPARSRRRAVLAPAAVIVALAAAPLAALPGVTAVRAVRVLQARVDLLERDWFAAMAQVDALEPRPLPPLQPDEPPAPSARPLPLVQPEQPSAATQRPNTPARPSAPSAPLIPSVEQPVPTTRAIPSVEPDQPSGATARPVPVERGEPSTPTARPTDRRPA